LALSSCSQPFLIRAYAPTIVIFLTRMRNIAPAKDFHGTLNFTFRNSLFNTANYFATTGKPPEQRRIFEGSLLRPLFGHYSFLISANRREQDLASSVQAYGPQGVIAANVSTPTRDNSITGRIGRDFNDNHSAYVQYHVSISSAINQGVGGLVLPEAGSDSTSIEHQLAYNDRLIITSHLINQFGIQFEKSQEKYSSVTNAPPLIVNGAFTGGGWTVLKTTFRSMRS
jgi:hypothetical protein